MAPTELAAVPGSNPPQLGHFNQFYSLFCPLSSSHLFIHSTNDSQAYITFLIHVKQLEMGDGKKRRKSYDETEHGAKKRSKKRENKDKRHKKFKSKENVNEEPLTDDEVVDVVSIDGPVDLHDDTHDAAGTHVNDDGASDTHSDIDDDCDAQSDAHEVTGTEGNDDSDDDLSEDDDCAMENYDERASPAPHDERAPTLPASPAPHNEMAPNLPASPAPQPMASISGDQSRPTTPGDNYGAVMEFLASDGEVQLRQAPCGQDVDDAIDAPIGAGFPPPIPGLEHRQRDIAARREEHRAEGTNGPNYIHTIIFNR